MIYIKPNSKIAQNNYKAMTIKMNLNIILTIFKLEYVS
jgi:hypothetical protein